MTPTRQHIKQVVIVVAICSVKQDTLKVPVLWAGGAKSAMELRDWQKQVGPDLHGAE